MLTGVWHSTHTHTHAHTHTHTHTLDCFHRVWRIVILKSQWGYSEPHFIILTKIKEMLCNVSGSWEYPENRDNSVSLHGTHRQKRPLISTSGSLRGLSHCMWVAHIVLCQCVFLVWGLLGFTNRKWCVWLTAKPNYNIRHECQTDETSSALLSLMDKQC